MAKVITFSRYFPSYHPKKGQVTCFVEQILNSVLPKNYRVEDDYLELEYLNEKI